MSLPDKLAPMLAVMADPFDSPDYLFEVKWDGWRCLAFLDGTTRLQSRNQRNINALFPELLELHQRVAVSGILLDGEIVTLWEGKPSFIRLQRRTMQRLGAADISNAPAVFIAFDLLYLKGVSLMGQTLEERLHLMRQNVYPGDALQISETFAEKGRKFFDVCQRTGLEGVVGKRRSSLYYPGLRSRQWRKCKVFKRSLFTVCGYTTTTNNQFLRTVALTARIDGAWVFFGTVTISNQVIAETLFNILIPLRTVEPWIFVQSSDIPSQIQWVRPEIVVEVEYLEITEGFKLRHSSWHGLRLDKNPDECWMV